MAVIEVKSPTELASIPFAPDKKKLSIFLGGSINGGKSIDWQSEIVELFKQNDTDKYQIILLNPRRSDWKSDWKENKNDTNFNQQVTWELNHLAMCDIIFMVFDKDGISPVSLIEFGLYAPQKKLLLCCPQEYFKSANLYITAEKYNVPYTDNFEQFKENITNWLKSENEISI